MPLAWPRAYVLVHTLSDVPLHPLHSAALLPWLLLLLLLATGPTVGDHHHHHRSSHYGGIAQSFAQALTGGNGGQGPDADNYYEDSPISRLNPWLSACDLAHPATAPDLQGPCASIMARGPGTGHAHPVRVNGDITEGPGPPGSGRLPATPPGPASDEKCPKSCSVHNASHTQCLRYFHESDKEKLCAGSSLSEARLAEFRLRHCCEHSVANSLTPEALKAVLSSPTQCLHYLGTLLDLDALAARLSCEFGEILSRFDCDHLYSVKYRCTHCQESYRRWVCSSLVPHFPRPGGPRVRPCRSACRSVEQKCPFFLPGDRAPAYPTQYAGEPTFLCVDPNIPESGNQRVNSLYGEDDCCYKHCDERGLPYLCLSNSSCAARPAENTPLPVICDPPPPAPTPPPGERTLPSACAAPTQYAPPPPLARPRPSLSSASSRASADRCLLGLIAILILHRLHQLARGARGARGPTSSPARKAVAVAQRISARAARARSASSNRPRPRPWPWTRSSTSSTTSSPRWHRWQEHSPRPRVRLRRPRRRRPVTRPAGSLVTAAASVVVRRVMLRTNRLGKRTTAVVILPGVAT